MRAILKLVLLTGFVCGLASAKDASEPFKYLTKDAEDALIASIPPPPVPNSPEDQSDLAAILDAQKNRTPDMVAEAKLDEHFSVTLFQPIYGADLTLEKNPKFYDLLKHTLQVSGYVDLTAKNKYKRPRPYEGHPDTVHSVFPAAGFSYPSGHSMASYALAGVLGAIFPDKVQAFLDRAGKIAQSRVDAGVHYPSDIKESEMVGKRIVAELLANPAFQKDLADVIAEVKK